MTKARSRLGSQILGNQPLDDDDIAPNAVQFAVFFVGADLAKSRRADESPAGLIFREDAGHQFPIAGLPRAFEQGPQSHPACAAATRGMRDVHRNLRDPRIAIPGTVKRRRRERDNLVSILDHYDRMHTIEPSANIIGRARPCLKSGYTIRNALVVNPSDRRGIVRGSGPGAHG